MPAVMLKWVECWNGDDPGMEFSLRYTLFKLEASVLPVKHVQQVCRPTVEETFADERLLCIWPAL